MKNKIFFFDIDGTLIDCSLDIKNMSSKTLYSLNYLKEKNHLIFIASGRCLCFMPDEIQNYAFNGYISCNGASITYNGHKIYDDQIRLSLLQKIDAFAQAEDIVYYLENDHAVYTNNLNHPLQIQFSNLWQIQSNYLHQLTHLDTLGVNMCMITCPDLATLQKAEAYFEDDFDVQVHPGKNSADLSLKTSSKGKAITFLLDYLDKPLANTVAFGDGPNDIEMFQTVALPLAMGNAVPSLKQVAKDVLHAIEDDGIYHGLMKYELIS